MAPTLVIPEPDDLAEMWSALTADPDAYAALRKAIPHIETSSPAPC